MILASFVAWPGQGRPIICDVLALARHTCHNPESPSTARPMSSGRINQKRKLKVGLVDFVKAITEIRLEELMLVAHRRADEESDIIE